MSLFKGKISTDTVLPAIQQPYAGIDIGDLTLTGISIVNTSTGSVDVSLYIRDVSTSQDIAISAIPITLKQGQSYIRDSAVKFSINSRIKIKTTGSIDYYIAINP